MAYFQFNVPNSTMTDYYNPVTGGYYPIANTEFFTRVNPFTGQLEQVQRNYRVPVQPVYTVNNGYYGYRSQHGNSYNGNSYNRSSYNQSQQKSECVFETSGCCGPNSNSGYRCNLCRFSSNGSNASNGNHTSNGERTTVIIVKQQYPAQTKDTRHENVAVNAGNDNSYGNRNVCSIQHLTPAEIRERLYSSRKNNS